MDIREGRISDLEGLAILFNGYRIFYGKTPDLAGAGEFLKHHFVQMTSKIFLAEDREEQRIAGFVQLYPLFSSVQMKRLWVLNDLYVDPHYRKQGIGGALLKKAQEWVILTQASGLMLETGKSNSPAWQLYEKMGFKRSQEYYVYYWSPDH